MDAVWAYCLAEIRRFTSSLASVNIFSPDGDGINDYFTFDFSAFAIKEFHCLIVDRWGVEMAEFDSIFDTWDGTTNGSNCPDGVCFYVYDGVAEKGTAFTGQGSLQLINSK